MTKGLIIHRIRWQYQKHGNRRGWFNGKEWADEATLLMVVSRDIVSLLNTVDYSEQDFGILFRIFQFAPAGLVQSGIWIPSTNTISPYPEADPSIHLCNY